MKVWIDISNAPHVRFFRELIGKLDDVLVTARNFGPIPDLLESFQIEHKLVGEHGGADPKSKLLASARRVEELTEIVSEYNPDFAVYKYSVEGARVALGLNIPTIATADNEIATFQNKLTLPFADKVLLPQAISREDIDGISRRQQVSHFNGVCEVAHVSCFKPDPSVLSSLSLDESKPIVLMRPPAYQAAYYAGNDLLGQLLPKLKEGGAQIVLIPRTEAEQKYKNDAILADYIDTLSIAYYSDLVISGGGTMTRESALLGVPSVSCFPSPLKVDQFLMDGGLLQHKQVPELASSLKVEKAERKKVPEFENPIQKISSMLVQEP